MYAAYRDLILISFLCVCCHVLEKEQPPWSIWAHHEAALKDATGLSHAEFDSVHTICLPGLTQVRLRMHAGKGKQSHMTTHNMLALTLYWLRQTPSFHSLASQYPAFSRTTIHRTVHEVINILHTHLYPSMVQPIHPLAPSSRRSSLQNVRLIIDSTFIPLPLSQKNKKWYHPRSPTKAALKVEIDCDLTHRIVNVSDVTRGAEHDMTLVRQSGILNQINTETQAIADKGYIGQLPIITPARKKRKVSKEAQLLQDERTRKRELQAERAAIENINQRFKQWSIVSYVWQQDYSDFIFVNKVVRVVAALANLILETHPIRYGRQSLYGR
jgi:hypothetical protein